MLLLLLCVVPLLAYAASEADDVNSYRRDLAYRLRDPMTKGMDVHEALADWFKAEHLAKTDPADHTGQIKLYLAGMAALTNLKPLPETPFPPNPTGVKLTLLEPVQLPNLTAFYGVPDTAPAGVDCRVVSFKVDKLLQYGVILRPHAHGRYPLLLFLHGAAFGVPTFQLTWLARLAARGYVVIAPALRGEPLFALPELVKEPKHYTCEGHIENLLGEVDDALGMVDGAFKLDCVAPGKFVLIGHSFGGGVGLLVAARAKRIACSITYDAWLVNPFRYYWDRLRDGPNNWLSWEAYTKQPIADQLRGLMERSIVHHADKLHAPALMFIGGAYNGSVFHQSHADLVARLKSLGKTYRYVIIPGGGHNFIYYTREKPAREAFVIQDKWLNRYLPPSPPKHP